MSRKTGKYTITFTLILSVAARLAMLTLAATGIASITPYAKTIPLIITIAAVSIAVIALTFSLFRSISKSYRGDKKKTKKSLYITSVSKLLSKIILGSAAIIYGLVTSSTLVMPAELTISILVGLAVANFIVCVAKHACTLSLSRNVNKLEVLEDNGKTPPKENKLQEKTTITHKNKKIYGIYQGISTIRKLIKKIFNKLRPKRHDDKKKYTPTSAFIKSTVISAIILITIISVITTQASLFNPSDIAAASPGPLTIVMAIAGLLLAIGLLIKYVRYDSHNDKVLIDRNDKAEEQRNSVVNDRTPSLEQGENAIISIDKDKKTDFAATPAAPPAPPAPEIPKNIKTAKEATELEQKGKSAVTARQAVNTAGQKESITVGPVGPERPARPVGP